MIILQNCRLIPELSGNAPFKYGDVIIENQIIKRIIETGKEALPRDARIINCTGKTLLPGLFDLHVHICTAGCGIGVEYKNDFDVMMRACECAQAFLDHGFTTIRDMGSTNRVACSVRDMIHKNILPGPRIIASGHIILPSGMLDTDVNSAYRLVSGSEEISKAVREEIGESYADIVKIYASGSAYHPGGEPEFAILTREEIRSAVQMAAFRQRKVAAHCHSAEAIHICIEEGVYTIEHGSYIREEDIHLLEGGNQYLVPTLSPCYYVPGTNKDPELDAFFSRARREMGEKIAPHIIAAYQAGLKLGFGSDMSDLDLGTYSGTEFRMRKELCNMSNIDTLLQATKYSALIAGLEDITGEVKEGLNADLILVEGNPDENIEVMYGKPYMVMRQGQIYRHG